MQNLTGTLAQADPCLALPCLANPPRTVRLPRRPRQPWQHRMRLGLVLWAGITLGGWAMAVEEAPFELLAKGGKDGELQLRRYGATIVAETLVEGDRDAASTQGFKVIADYIFGNNQAAGPPSQASGGKAPGGTPSEKIAMTAPVVAEPLNRSQKIAMTAPVTAEPVGGAAAQASLNDATRWRIHFVMPAQYTLGTLPRPNNPAVQLRELPPTVLAVVTYSGLNTAARVQQKTEELQRWIASRNLQPLGAPQLARYDPPWTLPMWRRNEVQVQVREP